MTSTKFLNYKQVLVINEFAFFASPTFQKKKPQFLVLSRKLGDRPSILSPSFRFKARIIQFFQFWNVFAQVAFLGLVERETQGHPLIL